MLASVHHEHLFRIMISSPRWRRRSRSRRRRVEVVGDAKHRDVEPPLAHEHTSTVDATLERFLEEVPAAVSPADAARQSRRGDTVMCRTICPASTWSCGTPAGSGISMPSETVPDSAQHRRSRNGSLDRPAQVTVAGRVDGEDSCRPRPCRPAGRSASRRHPRRPAPARGRLSRVAPSRRAAPASRCARPPRRRALPHRASADSPAGRRTWRRRSS